MEKRRRSKGKRILTAVIIVLVIAAASLPAASRLVWHRSTKATLVEIYRRAHYDGRFDTAEAAEEWMARRAAVEDRPYTLPEGADEEYASAVSVEEMCGRQVVVFDGAGTAGNAAQPIVLYLHGGAYVGGILPYHLEFCDRLAERSGARVLVPDYPLAPNHTWYEAYAFLDDLWKELDTAARAEGAPLILMGDSAGGGLAAAFCEQLAAKRTASSQMNPAPGEALPDQMILLSPWVDATMSGDYDAYLDADPSLAPEGLAACGAAWAGMEGAGRARASHAIDPADPRISPLFGFPVGLPQTTVFVGTREIFYPDVLEFYERLETADVSVQLIVGEGMNHVYPLYPMPEAEAALEMITMVISG